MKTYKLIIFSLVIFSFNSLSIFSQQRDFMEVSNEHLNEPFYDLEGKNNNNYLNEKRPELNIAKKSQVVQINSASVIDSVLVTRNSGNQKTSYNYDEEGNMTLGLEETWDGSQWTNDSRTTYTYDSNENMTSQLFEYWEENKWVKSYRYSYIYDSSNNLTSLVYEYRVEDQLVNDSRSTYTYDSNGNIAINLYETWNGNQWVLIEQYAFAYDPNGKMVLRLNQRWGGSQWENYRQDTYTYDSNGNMTLYLTEYNTPWENYNQSTYTYDSNDNLTLELKKMWDGSEWSNDSRITYSYDSNGNKTLELSEWYGEETQWVNDIRTAYTYDSNNNMTLELKQYNKYWDDKQWKNWLRTTYTYDSNDNVTIVSFEEWDENQWIISERYFDFQDSHDRWLGFYGSEIKLFYNTLTDISEEGLSINDFSLSQNYPNPFNPSTKIKFALPNQSNVKLEIYNMLGEKVKTLVNGVLNAGYHEMSFDAGNLSSGIYFYRIIVNLTNSADQYVSVRKMILLK